MAPGSRSRARRTVWKVSIVRAGDVLEPGRGAEQRAGLGELAGEQGGALLRAERGVGRVLADELVEAGERRVVVRGVLADVEDREVEADEGDGAHDAGDGATCR